MVGEWTQCPWKRRAAICKSEQRLYKQPKTVNYCLCYHTILTTASWRERDTLEEEKEGVRERGIGHFGHQENNSNVKMGTVICKLNRIIVLN